MKQILLLLLSTIFLIGCTASKGRQSYEEALHYIEQGDAPQALACLKEAAELASDDSLRMGIYSDMGRLLFDDIDGVVRNKIVCEFICIIIH